MLLAVVALSSSAKETTDTLSRHELRIGYGDAIMQSIYPKYDNEAPTMYSAETLYGLTAKEADALLRRPLWSIRDRYITGHIFVDYMYHINRLVSVGVDADFMAMGETVKAYDGYGTYQYTRQNHLYISSITPMVRFTYYEKKAVRLYSAIGIGYSCMVGKWYNLYDRHDYGKDYFLKVVGDDNYDILHHGFGINATLLGVQVGGKHLFGAFDLGGYNAFYVVDDKDFTSSVVSHDIVAWRLAFSRIMSISIGYKF